LTERGERREKSWEEEEKKKMEWRRKIKRGEGKHEEG
jgi:hypothetical protein